MNIGKKNMNLLLALIAMISFSTIYFVIRYREVITIYNYSLFYHLSVSIILGLIVGIVVYFILLIIKKNKN